MPDPVFSYSRNRGSLANWLSPFADPQKPTALNIGPLDNEEQRRSPSNIAPLPNAPAHIFMSLLFECGLVQRTLHANGRK